jgi:nitrate reductase molybdenum cofactor assembly chaperone NarJ/NarW
MRTLKLLSALLCYPSEDLIAAIPEIRAELSASHQAALLPLIDRLAGSDLLDLQADYVEAFDRGRRLSLHLFEHVHGESRDRGQAMVDLGQLYEKAGLYLEPGELPDYLPSFLEYLSVLPESEAMENLAEVAPILLALHEAATARETPYAAVFSALISLAGAAPQAVAAAKPELPDLEQLDAEWEEAEVRFGPGESDGGCSTDRLRTRLRAAARDTLKPSAAARDTLKPSAAARDVLTAPAA